LLTDLLIALINGISVVCVNLLVIILLKGLAKLKGVHFLEVPSFT
jgi:hypothetical protein